MTLLLAPKELKAYYERKGNVYNYKTRKRVRGAVDKENTLESQRRE
jgi:hypothetical protein